MYKKVAMFTDIHFGKKNNSEQHNQDCINYIKWFCEQVSKDSDIDCIFFLGDWHEHRSAINGLTLHYSDIGAGLLNDLGLPIYFCVGNHDLYFRNNRDIFTTVIFKKFENFIIVDKPLLLKDNDCVIAPFLFDEEYESFFKEHAKRSLIAGHFEFKGFVLTGETVVSDHGPDPDAYKIKGTLLSGHYHKRQNKNNIHYIGNTFPMDFGDANDNNRGMATYDFKQSKLEFVNWKGCPTYIKASLSEVLSNHKKILKSDARVKLIVDDEISLSENNDIRKLFAEKYNLREIVLDEQIDVAPELSDIEQEIEDLKLDNVNDVILELLKRIKSEKIQSEKLTRIYKQL